MYGELLLTVFCNESVSGMSFFLANENASDIEEQRDTDGRPEYDRPLRGGDWCLMKQRGDNKKIHRDRQGPHDTGNFLFAYDIIPVKIQRAKEGQEFVWHERWIACHVTSIRISVKFGQVRFFFFDGGHIHEGKSNHVNY